MGVRDLAPVPACSPWEAGGLFTQMLVCRDAGKCRVQLWTLWVGDACGASKWPLLSDSEAQRRRELIQRWYTLHHYSFTTLGG